MMKNYEGEWRIVRGMDNCGNTWIYEENSELWERQAIVGKQMNCEKMGNCGRDRETWETRIIGTKGIVGENGELWGSSETGKDGVVEIIENYGK